MRGRYLPCLLGNLSTVSRTDRSSLANHLSILTPSMGGIEVPQCRDCGLGRCLRIGILRIGGYGLSC